MWKTIVTAAALTPVAAIFVGVGVLAYNVSQTWDSRNTDALISGLVASCSMGGIVVAGLLAGIVGIPLAMRLMDRWREADRVAAAPMPRYMLDAPRAQWHEPTPPRLVDKQAGSWQTQGPATYDLWEDDGRRPVDDPVETHFYR